jgi:hypothetical protein
MNTSGSDDFTAGTESLHRVTHYAAQLRIVHILFLALLALVADYAWMLYMRWRMVSVFLSYRHPVNQY